MSIKIAIIGAGSAMFSLSLIKDICLTPNLKKSTVTFMDIDAQRLEGAYSLCQRYSEERGADLTLKKTLDRREALAGADFVIDTALASSYDHLREGWRVAKKHGYRFGGSLHVVHDEAFWINFYQLQSMEAMIRDIEEICPRAWFILVSNPVMAAVTYLGRKYPNIKLVGMCHGYSGVFRLAEVLGLDPHEISYEIPGVNHFVWLSKFYHKGQDALPLLKAWVEQESEKHFETCAASSEAGPKAVDLYRRFGLFPIGDTGNPGGGSWGHWYHSDDQTEARWKENPDEWYQDYFRGGLENVANIRRVAQDLSLRVSDAFPQQMSDEPMIPLIEALACDVERVVVVNIPNDGGYVPGVPQDFEVEIPALVSKKGIQGIRTGGLPKELMVHLWRDRIAPVEMELLAYEKGSRQHLVDLVLMDPWTRSEAQARALVEEILALPYHEQMRQHYR